MGRYWHKYIIWRFHCEDRLKKKANFEKCLGKFGSGDPNERNNAGLLTTNNIPNKMFFSSRKQ